MRACSTSGHGHVLQVELDRGGEGAEENMVASTPDMSDCTTIIEVVECNMPLAGGDDDEVEKIISSTHTLSLCKHICLRF